MFATTEWTVLKQRFIGGSLAGIGTSVGALDFGVCFDIANGPRHTLKFTDFCITHAHSDHAGGLAYVVSQKSMTDQKQPRFHVPEEILPGLQRILKEWELLEDYKLPCQLIPMAPNNSVALSEDISVTPFRTVHRVPSLGYTLFSKKKKLKPEFVGKHPQEIVQLKQKGVVTEEYISSPEMSFTGDTQIEVLERHPEILSSRLLFFEVSFYDDAKPVSEAKKWGHTHFEEMLPYLAEFRGEKLVLIHHSARYRMKDLVELVRKRTGDHFEKIFLAPSLYSVRE